MVIKVSSICHYVSTLFPGNQNDPLYIMTTEKPNNLTYKIVGNLVSIIHSCRIY